MSVGLCLCIDFVCVCFCVWREHMGHGCTNEFFSWTWHSLTKLCAAHCGCAWVSGVCALCLVWVSALTVCHLWVSFQVIPPKRAAFTAVPQSHRLLLTRTQHTHTHTHTYWQFFHPAQAHSNTKSVHFGVLQVIHLHCPGHQIWRMTVK